MELKNLIHIFVYKNRKEEGIGLSEIHNHFKDYTENEIDGIIEDLIKEGILSSKKIQTKKIRRKGARHHKKKNEHKTVYFPNKEPRYKKLTLLITKDQFKEVESGSREIFIKRDPENPLIRFVRNNQIRDDYDHIIIKYDLRKESIGLIADFESISFRKHKNQKESKTAYVISISNVKKNNVQ